MKARVYATIIIMLSCLLNIAGQDAASVNLGMLSPNASKANQVLNTPVNYFTGSPNISLPIYSYTNSENELGLNITIDYLPGGVRVLEAPTTVGLGWYLNAGGIVTRTVRGMPDDIPNVGFMYSSVIASDIRSDAQQYYYDSLDSRLTCLHSIVLMALREASTLVKMGKLLWSQDRRFA